MKISLFSVQDHYPDQPRTVPQLYEEVLTQAELADSLGYDTFFSAEHHFHHYGAVPNPPLMLASIAQRTKRLRLGTAISILTFHSPLTLAENYAMLDILSNGRLVLGVGSGYLPHEFSGYAVNGAEKRDRFDEGLMLIQRLLTGERVTHQGKFNTLTDVQINVLPVQQKIPTYIAALRPEVAYFIGKQGLGLLGIPYASLDHFDQLEGFVADYRRGRADAGLPSGPLAEPGEIICLHTHVADTDEEADKVARDPFELYVNTRLYAKKHDYAHVMKTGLGLFGSPETVARKLVALSRFGIGHVMTMQNFGKMNAKAVTRSMRLMTEEVLPLMKKMQQLEMTA